MKLAIIASLLLFFVFQASALIPADNISDNKSYIAEPNTNTRFDPENYEIFEPEETTIPVQTSQSTSSSSSSGGGSSGGGGGGGITSSENFSNILKWEERSGTLIAEQPTPFKFNLPIYEILLIGKENEYDVSVRVELLKDKPYKMTIKPEGEVIQYFNVVTSTKRMKEAVIRFKTNVSAYLLKWNNSEWIKLDMVENVDDIGLKIPQECIDEQYICYTYQANSFSSFAIIKNEQISLANLSDNKDLPIPIANLNDNKDTPLIIKQSSGFSIFITIIGMVCIWQLRKKS